jgi:Na+/H+-translocating membrane pyrophosphatase
MNTTGKITLGLGIASAALLAAYLFTGDRKKKTTQFIARKADDLKRAIRKKMESFDDSEAHYI